MAAVSVAARVAEETDTTLGTKVGYSIRFDDKTGPDTKIKFLTDGMMLREALVDPLFSQYSVIMIDEAHERSLSSDVLLGLLKKVMKKRPELRLIISSATIETDRFLQFFQPEVEGDGGAIVDSEKTPVARVISLEGRMYPVTVQYLAEPTDDYVTTAVRTVMDIHTSEPEGDILVFLTGRDEIDKAREMIADHVAAGPASVSPDSIVVYPLYAGLPTDQQIAVFDRPSAGTRKVIVATNIAEASVTIDGIVYVVDCGFVKLRTYNPSSGIETLTGAPVSQASAIQRAGRAGRTRPGKCFRLYPESSYHALDPTTVPELQRSNLAPLILQLKALGIDNVARFSFVTPPPPELFIRGLELLFALGAVDDHAKLTRPLGLRMAELAALEPMMAKALLSASHFGCLPEMLSIAAVSAVTAGSIWFDPGSKSTEQARRTFAVDEGDHLTDLNVFNAFVGGGQKDAKWCNRHGVNHKALSQAVSIRRQLVKFINRFGIAFHDNGSANTSSEDLNKGEQIRRCLAAGFFSFAAKMRPDGSFVPVRSGGSSKTVLYAHPLSLMFNRKAEWVIFGNVTATKDKIFIRDLTKVDREWLVEYGSGFYRVS